MAVTFLSLAVDIPMADDWRSYDSGEIDSFNPEYLFRSANDTMYPVGKFLDALAQHALNGNSVAYKFLSMLTVLGTILWLQWRLLSMVFDDRFVVACSFTATLLMLQPASYWIGSNLAYHQAIPLICLLASLYLIVASEGSIKLKRPLLFSLGLVSGFTYISGAFSTLAVAVVLLVIGTTVAKQRSLVLSALALGAAGLISSCAQAWVIVVAQGGKTHRPDAPWVSPLSSDFWMYLLGKIGRSLLLPASHPGFSLAVVLAVVIATFCFAYRTWVIARSSRGQNALETGRLCIFLSLCTAISVYLTMVAAARADLGRSADTDALGVFAFGFPRLHYFWVTLLWPWLAAIILFALRGKLSRDAVHIVAGIGAVLMVCWVAASGGLNYHATFARSARTAQEGIACIQKELITSNKILCPMLAPADLTRAYNFAVATGASFVSYVPPSLRELNGGAAED